MDAVDEQEEYEEKKIPVTKFLFRLLTKS